MRDERNEGVKILEWAMVGTLAIATAICVRLWFIMEDIRLALTDPNAMAFIIANDKIHSDSKHAEDMLNGARAGFRDTENALAVFSVCVLMIALAMAMRIWKQKKAEATGAGASAANRIRPTFAKPLKARQ